MEMRMRDLHEGLAAPVDGMLGKWYRQVGDEGGLENGERVEDRGLRGE